VQNQIFEAPIFNPGIFNKKTHIYITHNVERSGPRITFKTNTFMISVWKA
jgi:hypothetical protein